MVESGASAELLLLPKRVDDDAAFDMYEAIASALNSKAKEENSSLSNDYYSSLYSLFTFLEDWRRFLPIHQICVLNPPLDVVGSLINAYPESASALDQDGWLPLHCAAYYRASEPVISFLIGTNLDACKTKDEEGRVPIHYACMKKLPYTDP
jgi:ankyrin repeat protein